MLQPCCLVALTWLMGQSDSMAALPVPSRLGFIWVHDFNTNRAALLLKMSYWLESGSEAETDKLAHSPLWCHIFWPMCSKFLYDYLQIFSEHRKLKMKNEKQQQSMMANLFKQHLFPTFPSLHFSIIGHLGWDLVVQLILFVATDS